MRRENSENIFSLLTYYSLIWQHTWILYCKTWI